MCFLFIYYLTLSFFFLPSLNPSSFSFRIHSSFLSETTLVETRKQHKRQNKDYQIQDRITDLSDDVLVHMLSFLNVKKAIQTCILSKRWTNLWKTLPTLALNFRKFRTNKVSNNSFLRFYLLAMTQPLFVLSVCTVVLR